MYDITLISTRHDNMGACKSGELCRILESLKPQVIFEEMPPSYFDKYYIEKSQWKLEVEAINTYLETNGAVHIPVDSDNIPSVDFFQNYKQAVERVERLRDVNGFNYKNLSDRNRSHTAALGFKHLNSNSSIWYNDEIYNAVEKGLETINDDKLFEAYRLWNQWHDRREREMLDNIYTYSKANSYNRAVFLLGAAHRKAIIEKIKNYNTEQEQKINWQLYGE